MPPLKSLESVVAQVRRNYSSRPGSSNELNVKVESVVKGFADRVIPFYLGYAVAGPIIFGDQVSELEEERQKEWRKIYGASADEIGDLRDMVLHGPGLGETVYSYLSGWSETVYSHLSVNAARWWSARKF